MKHLPLIIGLLALMVLSACGDTTYVTNVYEGTEATDTVRDTVMYPVYQYDDTVTVDTVPVETEDDEPSSSEAVESSSSEPSVKSSSSNVIKMVLTTSTTRSSSSSKPVLSSSSDVKMSSSSIPSSSSSSIQSSSSIPVSSSSSIVRFIDCTTDTLNEYDECKLYQSNSRENCRDYIETSRTDISRQYDNRNPKKSCDIFKNYLSMVMVGDPITNAAVCMENVEFGRDPFWSKMVTSSYSYADTIDLANDCLNYYLILRNTKQPESN